MKMHSSKRHSKSLAVWNGEKNLVHLPLEFEGKRAFAIWDSVPLGNFQFKVRIEVNPRLLEKNSAHGTDFLYRGKLELPRPQDN